MVLQVVFFVISLKTHHKYFLLINLCKIIQYSSNSNKMTNFSEKTHFATSEKTFCHYLCNSLYISYIVHIDIYMIYNTIYVITYALFMICNSIYIFPSPTHLMFNPQTLREAELVSSYEVVWAWAAISWCSSSIISALASVRALVSPAMTSSFCANDAACRLFSLLQYAKLHFVISIWAYYQK